MSHAGRDQEHHYEIHEVDGGDAAVALDLETLHALTFWKDAPPIDPENGHWWIARLGKKPVGFAGMSESRQYPHAGYFSRVGVLPAHRGHGLQLRFLRAAEARARRNGWSSIVADTRDARSANNFAKAGYQIFDPERRWAYPDSIYWRKDLRNRPG
ncbi:MAG TPA: GNAT family N-acetyltransferase [Xanthobacteraceae bacterium]|nr:GNAT family N-acetyltransferase [Xanthobacteraceae bacterium]